MPPARARQFRQNSCCLLRLLGCFLLLPGISPTYGRLTVRLSQAAAKAGRRKRIFAAGVLTGGTHIPPPARVLKNKYAFGCSRLSSTAPAQSPRVRLPTLYRTPLRISLLQTALVFFFQLWQRVFPKSPYISFLLCGAVRNMPVHSP